MLGQCYRGCQCNRVGGSSGLRGESSRLRPALTVAAACREVAEGPRGDPVGDADRGRADESVCEAIAEECRGYEAWRDVGRVVRACRLLPGYQVVGLCLLLRQMVVVGRFDEWQSHCLNQSGEIGADKHGHDVESRNVAHQRKIDMLSGASHQIRRQRRGCLLQSVAERSFWEAGA